MSLFIQVYGLKATILEYRHIYQNVHLFCMRKMHSTRVYLNACNTSNSLQFYLPPSLLFKPVHLMPHSSDTNGAIRLISLVLGVDKSYLNNEQNKPRMSPNSFKHTSD